MDDDQHKESSHPAGLQQAIRTERKRRRSASQAEPLPLIAQGKRQTALENLIFFTAPQEFAARLERVLCDIETGYQAASTPQQVEQLAFLAELILSLRSILPRWNLQNAQEHAQAALETEWLLSAAERVSAVTRRLAVSSPDAQAKLLSKLLSYTEARLTAEQANDPTREARALAGTSLAEYVENASQEITASKLRSIAEMRFAGQTLTELSNDYAAFLDHALYLGASFATTNPPLVNMALEILPEYWTPTIDRLIHHQPEASPEHLARQITLEVVLEQMRLLRPIFLLTEGRMGCVCLQVDPNLHANSQAMIQEANFFYEEMRRRLKGGVPNVVFKLPGTRAGLEACRALTRRGIGVTITVEFGMFQHIPFLEAILSGQAIFSCLVEMNGRLAFPVRDELLANLERISALGIDEKQARQAAAWAGILVARRLYQLLQHKNIAQERVKILIASLRIYQGEMYADLPSAFPDITETMGARLLSVFPNIRRAFDHSSGIHLYSHQIAEPAPEHVLQVLEHSEIFKQAYYASGQGHQIIEEDRFRPSSELRLEDEARVFTWPPVHHTLTEFINSYNHLVERLAERKRNHTP